MRDDEKEEDEKSPAVSLLARASKDGAAVPKYGAKYYAKYLEKKKEKKKANELLRGAETKREPLFDKGEASEVLNDLFQQLSSLAQVRTADPIRALQHTLMQHTWHNTPHTHRNNRVSSIVLKATSIPARRL